MIGEARGGAVVVLVEGNSDRLAVEALARRRGLDLGHVGAGVVATGGATNVRRSVGRYRDARVAALCDLPELAVFRRVLDGDTAPPPLARLLDHVLDIAA